MNRGRGPVPDFGAGRECREAHDSRPPGPSPGKSGTVTGTAGAVCTWPGAQVPSRLMPRDCPCSGGQGRRRAAADVSHSGTGRLFFSKGSFVVCFWPGRVLCCSQTRKSPARRIGTPIPGSRPIGKRPVSRFPIPGRSGIGNREIPPKIGKTGDPIPDSRVTSEHQPQ